MCPNGIDLGLWLGSIFRGGSKRPSYKNVPWSSTVMKVVVILYYKEALTRVVSAQKLYNWTRHKKRTLTLAKTQFRKCLLRTRTHFCLPLPFFFFWRLNRVRIERKYTQKRKDNFCQRKFDSLWHCKKLLYFGEWSEKSAVDSFHVILPASESFKSLRGARASGAKKSQKETIVLCRDVCH